MNRQHKNHTYKRTNRKAVEKMEALNDEMRKDCMNYILPKFHNGTGSDREDIRFAQKIFRTLLKQSAVVEG